MTDKSVKPTPRAKGVLAKAEKDRTRRPVPSFAEDKDGHFLPQVISMSEIAELYSVANEETAFGLLTSALHAMGNAGELYKPFIASMVSEMETSDAIEAMLVTQMTATHIAITGMSQKMLDCTNVQTREAYERSLTRLSRTFLALVEALKKYRAKAQQTVRVERVTVNDGGQAVVGDVHHGND